MKPSDFVSVLKARHFGPISGVPCSIFKSFLNTVQSGEDIPYIPASSEGEAMGVAAGFALNGRYPVVLMQSDGFANAINPLTSLQSLYDLPALLLISWRGQPGLKDAPQHTLMGEALTSMLDTLHVPWAVAANTLEAVGHQLDVLRNQEAKGPCRALIVTKGYFESDEAILPSPTSRSSLPFRADLIKALKTLAKPDDIFIGTTGFSGREMDAILDNPLRFPMMGSMGCAASLGLAVALDHRDKRVFVLDGDGAILMKMGTLATIGKQAPNNLVHICFDNEGYESTGGQAMSGRTQFTRAARACGYGYAEYVSSPAALKRRLIAASHTKGPAFLHCMIQPGADPKLPRPTDSPQEIVQRWRSHMDGLGDMQKTKSQSQHTPSTRRVLLTPGPATTSEQVKWAQGDADFCPREDRFVARITDIRSRLAHIVDGPKDRVCVPIGGSGTAAMDATLRCFVPDDKKVLVIVNGAYGARLKTIAERVGIDVETVDVPVTEVPKSQDVAQRLDNDPDIAVVAMVHHETTTGLLNPADEIGRVTKAAGRLFVVDCISSYAAIPIDMDAMNADVLIASSNKGLQAMAGLGLVIASRTLWRTGGRSQMGSLYLDVMAQFQEFEKTGQFLYTPPVHVLHAVQAALDEWDGEGGIDARHRRYRENWRALRDGLNARGFRFLLHDDQQAQILLSVLEPDDPNFDFDTLHDRLVERGFTIYPGKHRALKYFRLSAIGDLDAGDIAQFFTAFDAVIHSMGLSGPVASTEF